MIQKWRSKRNYLWILNSLKTSKIECHYIIKMLPIINSFGTSIDSREAFFIFVPLNSVNAHSTPLDAYKIKDALPGI